MAAEIRRLWGLIEDLGMDVEQLQRVLEREGDKR